MRQKKMEEGYELDLTYVTERIIAVSFPKACSEEMYLHNLHNVTRMLKSKHANNFLVINLSDKRHELTKMTPKIMDTGWPDLHAPPLDKICTICKAMESWLNAEAQHVAVIHCRGGKGRIGVIIASFIHFTDVSASAEQALERFAMRKFYDDKVSALMTPSQKRYVWILNNLLTGSIKMNTSPQFLHCVVLHGIPDFETGGVCRPYVKVYQGMQVVYTSGIYHIGNAHRNRLYISLEPAQLLKGDIMVKCYHKNIHASNREVIFRLQFHTGTVQGYSLIFEKEDLEIANKDPRFPDYGKVEVVLSESPERMQGSERWKNVSDITVDYSTTDPIIRWDSYQNVNSDGEVPHCQGLPDVTSHSNVRFKNLDGPLPRLVICAPDHRYNHALSSSSDSGVSSTSVRTGTAASTSQGPSVREATQLRRLLNGFGQDPRGDMSESDPSKLATRPSPLRINGGPHPRQRETDILDDEVLGQDVLSVDSIGTLSSSEGHYGGYHKSSQNSLLSDGFGCNPGEDHGVSELSSTFHRGVFAHREPQPHAFSDRGYSTQSWVRHQQQYSQETHQGNHQYLYPSLESGVGLMHGKQCSAPDAPARGSSSRDAVQRVGPIRSHSREVEDELASLTVDIDQSIDQLNRLIMDLDPTFVPVPTRDNSARKGGPVPHVNGSTSLYIQSGTPPNVLGSSNGMPLQNVSQSAGLASDFREEPKRIVSRQGSVTDPTGPRPHVWGGNVDFQVPVIYTSDQPSCQPIMLCRSNSVEARRCFEEHVSREDMISPTPAFPIPPPTPYVKSVPDFPPVTLAVQHGGSHAVHRTEREPRRYLENVTLSPLPSDADRFHLDVPVSFNSNTSSPRSLASMRSVSSDGLSFSAERTNDRFGPQYGGSMEYGLTSPGPYPKPCEGQVSRYTPGPVESTLNGHVMVVQPPLPVKRRTSQGDHSAGSTSPPTNSLPSPLPELQTRTPSTPSPLPDPFAGKQETAKFVQDTSKFWYKPDILRDQAIAILKDKEPGSFIVRDSHSFRGAYGLAMKVATAPPSVLSHCKKAGDASNELVRHFLIECTQKGVRLKGCPNEPYFGSLTALVCHHSIASLALPCKLIIPDRDPLEDVGESVANMANNSAAELLKQGAACNVWFLGSVEMESLTGYQAIQKATSMTLSMDPPPTSTVVHFKVSSQGITLTDNQRRLFFRRHYGVNTVIFCALDPEGRKWMRDSCSSAKIFGFVARKTGRATENVCHLFAEHDPEQPATAIVNFVSKVMIGSLKNK